jgi:hypothetical protein
MASAEPRPFNKIRMGFYLEVEMEGRDVTDGVHRAEDALHAVGFITGEGDALVSVHETGTAHGRVIRFLALHAHREP